MALRRVSAREGHQLVSAQGYIYLDVRAAPEFDTGHPEGAYNVPLLEPRLGGGTTENALFVQQVRSALGRQTKIVVGCATGVRSLRAAELLMRDGFEDVVEQRAGMEGVRDAFGRVKEPGYRAEGLPVAKRAEPGRSYAELRAATARGS